jgi:hypothetical protein
MYIYFDRWCSPLYLSQSQPPRLTSCLSGNFNFVWCKFRGTVNPCVSVHVMSNSAILYFKLQLRCLKSHVIQLQRQMASDYWRILPKEMYCACKSCFPLWTQARYTHDQGKYLCLHWRTSVHDRTVTRPGSLWNTERYLTWFWLERGGSYTVTWTQGD